MRIVPDVGFGGGVDIAINRARPAHDDNVGDIGHNARFQCQCQGNIRQRSNGYQRNFTWVRHDHINNKLGGRARIGFSGGRRQFNLAQAVLAMDKGGCVFKANV